jgi:hypothetical protein
VRLLSAPAPLHLPSNHSLHIVVLFGFHAVEYLSEFAYLRVRYKKTHAGGLHTPRIKTAPYIQGVLRKVCKTDSKGISSARGVQGYGQPTSGLQQASERRAPPLSHGLDLPKSSAARSSPSQPQKQLTTQDDEEAHILFDLALHNVLKSVHTPFQLSRIVSVISYRPAVSRSLLVIKDTLALHHSRWEPCRLIKLAGQSSTPHTVPSSPSR